MMLSGGVVDVFVDWDVNGVGFGHRDRHVLFYGHVVRFLNLVGHRLLHCDRVRLLDRYVDGLHDRHLYFLRYPDVDGIGLGYTDGHSLGHRHWYGVGDGNTDHLDDGGWRRLVDVDVLCDLIVMAFKRGASEAGMTGS